MRDHLKAFLQYLKLNRHVSPHTVRAYESDVSQYLAFVAATTGKKISELGAADLDMDSVRLHLAGQNKADAGSMRAALELAVDLAHAQARERSASAGVRAGGAK